MSGTFPTTPAPSAITPSSHTPTEVSTAQSLKQQVRSRGAHRFNFNLVWSKMKRSDMAPIVAFMQAQRGQYESFTFVPPVIGSRRASGTSAVTVQTATTTGRSIPITGAVAGEEVGLAGDYLKFAGHTKAYMLTADAVADASGNATLAIEPALFADVAAGESVTLDNVPFTVAAGNSANPGAAHDVLQWPVTPGILYDFSLDLVERP